MCALSYRKNEHFILKSSQVVLTLELEDFQDVTIAMEIEYSGPLWFRPSTPFIMISIIMNIAEIYMWAATKNHYVYLLIWMIDIMSPYSELITNCKPSKQDDYYNIN